MAGLGYGRPFDRLFDGRDADVESVPLSSRLRHSYSLSSLPTLNRPRLVDKSRKRWGLERFNMENTFWIYWNDLFHTLLNMPRWRFFAVFFGVYIVQYFFFALLYLSQPNTCIQGIRHLTHAVWFSVQTAATLGYGDKLEPNPNCASTNILIMIQVILSSLVDYAMLGIVFARFSAPSHRAQTIRFSLCAVAHKHTTGFWCISFRIANVRQYSILKPTVQVVLATPLDGGTAAFQFRELELERALAQQANLKLGLPAAVTHVVDPQSPLHGLSLDEMERRCIELLVFLDGIDATTSNCMQARHSYTAADIRMNEAFSSLNITKTRGQLGLDFSNFDSTVIAGLGEWGVEAPAAFTSHQSLEQHNQQLRSVPFRLLEGDAQGAGENGSRTPLPEKDIVPAVAALCDAILLDNGCTSAIKSKARTVKTLVSR